jgi:recombinational DNA repair protein (RecF pathway)
VHLATWTSQALQALLQQPGEPVRPADFAGAAKLDRQELWRVRNLNKRAMLEVVRSALTRSFHARGDSPVQLSAMLAGLADGRPPQPILRIFEYRLLNAAGFGLQLDREADSGCEIHADAWYLYVPESGPVRRRAPCADVEELVSGSALLALKSGELQAKHLKELKNLMRRLIRHHLGDRAIMSQQLFV